MILSRNLVTRRIALFALLFVLALLLLIPASAALDKSIAIKSASEYDYPPFSVVTTDGRADGFSVELLRAALNATGYSVEFKVGPWSEIKEELADGKIQVLPLVGRTPERELIYDFSVPYISLYGAIFVRKGDARIKSIDDLKDKEVLVMKGDNAEEFARRENISSKIIMTKTYEEAFRLLSEGRYDAIIVQKIVGFQLLADIGIDSIVPVAEIRKFKQDFTFAVKEGDSGLLSVLNEGLSQIIIDGTFDKIHEKWLGKFSKDLSAKTDGNASAADYWTVPQDPVSRAQLIVEYDKILTSYSLDYIVSGNVFWKEQYDRYGARLDKLIQIAKLNADSKEQKDLFDRQNQANLVLVDMELRAHALVSDGKREEAKAIIESKEYAAWKKTYSDVISEYLRILGVDDASGAPLEEESLTGLSVRLKALEVANQVDYYIRDHPEKTIAQLQNDSFFKSLAVQRVGTTGYTSIIDSGSGMIYFHPQKKLIGEDSHQFSASLPSFWAIMEKTMGLVCKDSYGSYDWKEEDGSVSKKYMYLACVKSKTADGKSLFVGAATYLDELDASYYLNSYKVGEFSTFAQDSIKQKAVDVAKQLEIYIKARPRMTVADLQNDSYFKSIAVQLVGKTGYTAVADSNTLINRFHQNPKIVNLDLSTLAEKLPGFWRIMLKTRGGLEAEGVYDWVEADGSITQKYMYIAVVNAVTADGARLNVAATTYLDEYAPAQPISQNISSSVQNASAAETAEKGIRMAPQSLETWLFSFAGALLFIFVLLFILQKAKVVVLEANIIFYMMGIVVILIVGVFILNTYNVTSNLREQAMGSFQAQQLLLAKQTANMVQTYFEFILNDARVTSSNPDLLGGAEAREMVLDRMHNRLDFSSDRVNDGINIALISRNGSLIDERLAIQTQDGLMADAQASASVEYYSAVERLFASGRTEISGPLQISSSNSSRPAVIILLPVLGEDNDVTVIKYAFQVAVFIDKPFLDTFSEPLNLSGEAHAHLIIGNVSFSGMDIPGEGDFFKDPAHVDLMQKISADISGVSEHGHRILLDGVASTRQVISAYTPVDVLDKRWAVTLEIPVSSAYAPISQSIGRVWIFALTLIFLTLIGGMFAVVFITDHLRKEVHDKTSEVAEANKNLESTVKERTAELEKLNIELESRVSGRTEELNTRVKELTDTRTAILNILEDVNSSKDEIEESHDRLLSLNKEMKKANEELKKADYYKNQFISITAHELKTPLASIHGFANLLQNKKILSNAKQRDNYLSIIMQDSDRLKKLIDDILDLSRLDVGTMKFVFEKVDVHEVFKDVMKEMYILASKNSLSLKMSVADDVPMIIVDKSRLSQVLINLTSNSVKYNVTKNGKIIVRAERHGRSVLFFVKDTGIGIPKKSQAKIFQRFYQVESWLTRKVGGSGLGLSICKGIVEALGGKIGFKSVEGKGSTFFFTLPVSRKVDFEKEQNLSVVKAPEEEGTDKSKNENKDKKKDKKKDKNKKSEPEGKK